MIYQVLKSTKYNNLPITKIYPLPWFTNEHDLPSIMIYPLLDDHAFFFSIPGEKREYQDEEKEKKWNFKKLSEVK